MKKIKKGFTLIELLVVVLIIGILAAVALPQYNNAVSKSRAVKLIMLIQNIEKAVDLYVLENGYQDVTFTLSDLLIDTTDLAKEDSVTVQCSADSTDPYGCYISFAGRYVDISLDKARSSGKWADPSCTDCGRACFYWEGDKDSQTQCEYLKILDLQPIGRE